MKSYMLELEEIRKKFKLIITRPIPECVHPHSVSLGNEGTNFVLEVGIVNKTMVQAYDLYYYPEERVAALKKEAKKVW